MPNSIYQQLTQQYQYYLEALKSTAPELLGPAFSNPYYSSIPDRWFDTNGPRIMVVGEEGFGTWGCGKGDGSATAEEIEKIQQLNYRYLKEQLDPEGNNRNNSAFWRRLRRIAQHGICCWTNIDKIHRLDPKKCVLSEEERKQLHSLSVKILQKEIHLLNPTHIVFFGWHWTSLQHELPDIYAQLYPNKKLWDQNVTSLSDGSRHYIFSYHPNWGYRHKGYEEKVVATLLNTV